MNLLAFVRNVAAFALLAIALLAPASAAEFAPIKPVRLIYPFAAGTVGDLYWRALATRLSRAWGQPVLVENKPGAGGIIAAEYVLSQPPDGHTLLAAGTTLLSLGLFTKTSFDPVKDLRPVAITYIADAVLATNSVVPAKNYAEFVAYAKANPGKMNYASLGKNSIMMYLEWFKRDSGTRLVEVPYKGTPEQIDAMLRNDVQLLYMPARAIKQHIDSGKLRPLFVISKERLADLPDVPTNAEVGLPDYRPPQWTAVMAPSKVPVDVVRRIRADIAANVGAPEVEQLVFNQGNRTFKGILSESDELFDYSARTLVELAKELNIRPE